jgi:hypothetical protein
LIVINGTLYAILLDIRKGSGIFYDLVANLDDIDDNLCLKEASSTSSMDLTYSSSYSTDLAASDDELEMGAFNKDFTKAACKVARRKLSSVDENVLKKLRKYTFSHHVDLGGDYDEEQQLMTGDIEQQVPSILFDQWDGLMDDMTQNFKPWEHHPEAATFVSKLDPAIVKPTWGVLYCGGKGKLLENLKKATKDADIKLHQESFSW